MMTVMTREQRRSEHPEVSAARDQLAAIRRELTDVETDIARTPRSAIVELHPLLKRKNVLAEQLAAAERSLRARWARHEGRAIIEADYAAVTDAVEEYIASVARMHEARAGAVEARATFNMRFQSARKGVPVPNGYPDKDPAPPQPPLPPLTSVDFAHWQRSVRREFEAWRATWSD